MVRMMRMTTTIITLLLAVLYWAAGGQAQDKARAIDAFLTGYHEAGLLNGAALVAQHGKVVFRKGFGFADFEWQIPNTPDTKFRLGSITKQFTATLIMQLVNEGKLRTDAKLSDVLPYYRSDTGRRITVEHLLTHTSGIPSYTGLPNFMSEISRDPYGVKDFVQKYCSGDLEFEPGTAYRYNNSGYFILGAIVEHLTGKPYERVLKERVFEPLGMHDSGYDRSQPVLRKRARAYTQRLGGVVNADYLDMSLPYAAGSLYSTVDDLYLWDQALYTEKVLPASARDQMFTPRLSNYGFGWGIRKDRIGFDKAERLMIGHGGGINGFNTQLTRIPEDRHLVVLLNNTGTTNLNAMVTGVIDLLYGRTPAAPRKPVARALYETILAADVKTAIAQYREIAKTRAAEFDMGEGQLVRLGNELVADERPADAVQVLLLNVDVFPSSAPAHFALAEAYRRSNEPQLAIKALTRTLELDPAHRNASERLQELAGHSWRTP